MRCKLIHKNFRFISLTSSDPAVHALQFLDVINMKDPTQKAHFYRSTLKDALPFIPRVSDDEMRNALRAHENFTLNTIETLVAARVALFAAGDEAGRGPRRCVTARTGNRAGGDGERIRGIYSTDI